MNDKQLWCHKKVLLVIFLGKCMMGANIRLLLGKDLVIRSPLFVLYVTEGHCGGKAREERCV